MVISRLWLQGVILTFVFGFAVLGYLALRIYEDHAPVPKEVVSDAGPVFTGEDIYRGQRAFLTYGLMQYGSVYGHGAYLGPDFTADYLHRSALLMQEYYGGGAFAEERVRKELQANRHDPATGKLTWTAGQVHAF
jgi:nitric oxide reductase subunit B